MECKRKESMYACILTNAFLNKFEINDDTQFLHELLKTDYDIDINASDVKIYFANSYPFKGYKNSLKYNDLEASPHKAVYFNCWNQKLSAINVKSTNFYFKDNKLTLGGDAKKNVINMVVIINCIYGPGVLDYCSYSNVTKTVRFTKSVGTLLTNVSERRLCSAFVNLTRENYQRYDLDIDKILDEEKVTDLKKYENKDKINIVYSLGKREFTTIVNYNAFETFLSFLTFYFSYVLTGFRWCIKNLDIPFIDKNSCFNYNVSNYDLISYYININRMLEDQYFTFVLYDKEKSERYLLPVFNNDIFKISTSFLTNANTNAPIINFLNTKIKNNIPSLLGGNAWSNPSLQTIFLNKISLNGYVYDYSKEIGCRVECTNLIDDIFSRYFSK